MSAQRDPSVAVEGNVLDDAIDKADLRMSQADQVYKTWGGHGIVPALRLVAKFKAASGAASPALLDKLTAALAVRSEEEIGQLLDQIVAQGAMGGQLKDTDKARYKSAEEARLAKTARFVADGGRPLARPVSDGRGRPLE